MPLTLGEILRSKTATLVPGVGDALGALLVAEAGFPCVYLSGYFASAVYGYLDVGLVSSTEMITQAARIVQVVDIPLIADADTGYGNALNMIRTVREYEQVGVAGIHIEDQALPKKFGTSEAMALVPAAEMCKKIEAAIDARRSRDFQIIARSDAAGTFGIDEAVRRARQYMQAGADAFKVMGARSIDDLKRFRDGIDGPLVCTVGSWGFQVSAEELSRIGYAVGLYTVSMLRRQIAASREVLAELKTRGTIDHERAGCVPMQAMHELLGIRRIEALEQRYSPQV